MARVARKGSSAISAVTRMAGVGLAGVQVQSPERRMCMSQMSETKPMAMTGVEGAGKEIGVSLTRASGRTIGG